MRSTRSYHAALWVLQVALVTAIGITPGVADDEPPPAVKRWLGPQRWQRDTDGPSLSLGPGGQFDDRHIFAPCVARVGGEFRLWYCGSRGRVAERVFALGLATSRDGRLFRRHAANPVLAFDDRHRSVLTACLLRGPDGRAVRERGRFRMWFSTTDFTDGTGRHALFETSSADGVRFDKPRGPLLNGVYAPSVIKDDSGYRLWYTDVAADPWCFRYATSSDGRRWQVEPRPVLEVGQAWERSRLFYPRVVASGRVLLMWYGSYWAGHPRKTAIGFAASLDGRRWYRHPDNPVLKPDSDRTWESHYTTSQSVLRLADGRWRIWYASRRKPPFVNKYFAIGTATWTGPPARMK